MNFNFEATSFKTFPEKLIRGLYERYFRGFINKGRIKNTDDDDDDDDETSNKSNKKAAWRP